MRISLLPLFFSRRLRALVMLLLVASATGSQAVQGVSFRAQDLNGPGGLRASGIQVTIDLSGKGASARIRITRLTLPALPEPLRDLRLHCGQLALSEKGIDCAQGRLRAQSQALGELDVPVAFAYRTDDANLQLDLPRLALSFSSADGNIAAEKLVARVHVELEQTDAGWQFQGELAALSGQAYVDPIFIDFGASPATLNFAGSAADAGDAIEVSRFDLDQPQVLRATGGLSWANNELQTVRVDVERAQLPQAYASYAQPFLIGTALDAITPAGQVQARLRRDADGWSAIRIQGQELAIEDEKGRFQLNGGELDARWQRDGELPAADSSTLRWASAALYRIELGATQVNWQMGGDDVVLTEPVAIPVFDGRLEIDQAKLLGLTGDNPEADINARLTPIRLAAFSQALGWPEFSGTISGELPGLAYRDGELTLVGALSAKVFDGSVSLEQLSITNPLGTRPRLRADATARGLDLETMSSAFKFGRITGRLDADVKGLRMLGWLPVAFDAWLRTPENDRSRHRISQGAIDDIASLGGGGAGLLKRGALGLFDDFAYDRIGLGCKLDFGVCQMRGLGPADTEQPGGFVIVRGRWLPRIDVVGYNRRVSWPVLLEQLKSIDTGSGPVINPEQPPQ